jgi:hypothetical protein
MVSFASAQDGFELRWPWHKTRFHMLYVFVISLCVCACVCGSVNPTFVALNTQHSLTYVAQHLYVARQLRATIVLCFLVLRKRSKY